MADLGKAYVQIVPKATGIEGKIKSAVSPGAGKAGKDAGNSFASNLKKTIASAAIGATVVKGFQMALDEGGKLQQSYGGLETLYGDAADAAKAYAAEAAKAGISANDYAEQAVSFGASLRAAFGGDNTKAVEAANTAIMDMADNAAKMGTPLESIQNAYQGFAKQNYTMLDNLKLGYGGTKAEMQRLLEDATKLTGVEYNMDNLGDVYAAIHAIQTDLGLTGVAAAEASTTFPGSFGAMQAAAKNLLANLALGGDVSGSMAQLGASVSTFLFDNLIPMVGNVLQSIPAMLDGMWEAIFGYPIDGDLGSFMDGVFDFIYGILPDMVSTGFDMVQSVAGGFLEGVPDFGVACLDIISTIADLAVENAPTLLEEGGELLQGIIDGIIESLPGLEEGSTDIIDNIATYLEENLPTISEEGGEILRTLGESLVNNIPTLLASVGRIGISLVQALARLVPVVLRSGANIVGGLAKGIGGSALGLLKKAMETIQGAIEQPIQDAKDTISDILDKVKGFFPIDLGRIFSGIELPHFTISGGEVPWGIGGLGTPPSVGVKWYAKAMNQPYMLNSPTLFGAGEAGDEMIYGRASLMRDIREAAGRGTTNVYVTVNGAESPEEWAVRFANEFKLQARTA